MKAPTLRRNGKREITMRVTHHIDGRVLHAALALVESEFYERTPLTPEDADRVVREELAFFGTSRIDWWSEKVFPEERRDRYHWAREQVQRLYPTMLPDVPDADEIADP